MGGESTGEVASGIVKDQLEQIPQEADDPLEELVARIKAAHEVIREKIRNDPYESKMGTTATAVWIRDGEACWVHAGDSRLYLFRNGVLTCQTRDHTAVGLLLKRGEITLEEAKKHPMRNALLNYVGGRSCKPQKGHFSVQSMDILLVASDGLYGEVEDEVISSILGSNDSLPTKLKNLIQSALNAGGSDNITVAGAAL